MTGLFLQYKYGEVEGYLSASGSTLIQKECVDWYYQSTHSFWISVDPLSDKYPNLSPYAYCGNNPIVMKDPDGCFGIPIHQEITNHAIVKTKIVSKYGSTFSGNIIKGVAWADYWGFAADWHFDNRKNYSEVQTRWNSLNKDISKSIGEIKMGNFNKHSVIRFGKLLHNVQDFYAHSNYAELYIEYYQNTYNGALPSSLPTYDDGIKNADFNALLKEKLRTGDFHLLDNENFDINPFQEHANEPTSHNKMNKDNADTYAGSLAKQAATAHTMKILKKIE